MNKNLNSDNMPEYLKVANTFVVSSHTETPGRVKVFPNVRNKISNILPNGNYSKRELLVQQMTERELSEKSRNSSGSPSLPRLVQSIDESTSPNMLAKINYTKVKVKG